MDKLDIFCQAIRNDSDNFKLILKVYISTVFVRKLVQSIESRSRCAPLGDISGIRITDAPFVNCFRQSYLFLCNVSVTIIESRSNMTGIVIANQVFKPVEYEFIGLPVYDVSLIMIETDI